MTTPGSIIENRLQHLESHLEQENPVLLKTVQSFRELDQVGYRMGILSRENSFATQIPWWPLIAILGTFSAGKSTFINTYLGTKIQRSGNQAVDDKFSVICFSREQTSHALPGVALDSDPRFPFYKISTDIEKVAKGEGARIDSYLQLKTSPSERLRGKILIDSPGFDADAQRTATLRITDHIINLSDLVLVFFDARHPEPGAMRDTLDHLVTQTIQRQDASKFMYVLNQLDTTAKEDNPEDVVAAWQRALGERGLTAGRFYTIYNKEAAVPIDDEALRRRFEKKRDEDMDEIYRRMHQVEVERAYRIVGSLEKTALEIEQKAVPAVIEVMERWRKRVVTGDIILAVTILIAFFGITISQDAWNGLSLTAPWWTWLSAEPIRLYVGVGVFFALWLAAHFGIRQLAAKSVLGWARKRGEQIGIKIDLATAFTKNTKPWRSIFSRKPAGWGRRSQKQLKHVIESVDDFVQSLNDSFTNPSGGELDDQNSAKSPDQGANDLPPSMQAKATEPSETKS